MPQMNPMNWVLIFLVLLFSLITISSKIYFFFNPSPNSMIVLPKTVKDFNVIL